MISVGSTKILPYEKTLIQDVLNSNQISPGKYCKRFEEEFKEIHHLKHAAFVSSGTDALRIALEALKEKYAWPDGTGVIVPAVTFVATINIVLQCRLRPILVDINLNDFGINPHRLLPSERRYVGMGKYNSHVNFDVDGAKCLIVAHLFGQPADMANIMKAAAYHNLKVIEDSCETMFVTFEGKSVGTFGDVACFSTYACHVLSTGVGGFVATQDKDLNTIIRSLANHGRDPEYIPGYSKPKSVGAFIDRHFKYDRVGYSSRATELQAALGLGQLKVYKDLLFKRRSNARYLNNELGRLDSVKTLKLYLPQEFPNREHAWMMYPLVVGEGYEKRGLMLHLAKHGIEVRHLMPIINQPCYKGMKFVQGFAMSQAEEAHKRGFYMGCHAELTLKDLDKIVQAVDKFTFRRYK